LFVVAPVEITSGSVAGLPMVEVMPASPEEQTTVTPAATAWSLNAWNISRELRSGYWLRPSDSLITSTCATVTA
jgi:hypothetical protein